MPWLIQSLTLKLFFFERKTYLIKTNVIIIYHVHMYAQIYVYEYTHNRQAVSEILGLICTVDRRIITEVDLKTYLARPILVHNRNYF